MINGIQARADELSSTRANGRFRSVTSMNDGQTGDSMIGPAVARAKEGDREAIRFLYVRYADNVYGYVRSIVRDDFEAEDVTQHVFAKLMTIIGKYEEQRVPFSAWILRVARNAALDHVRQRRAIPCDEVRELNYQPPANDDAQQTSIGLREALEALPEDQREVIVLRHVVGLTPGEIAGRMGKSEPSVHGLHHRGRGTLRRALQERECAPAIRHALAA